MSSPRQHQLKRNFCPNVEGWCWLSLKGGAALVIFGWAFYVLFLTITTHPCWMASNCWASLVMGGSRRAHLAQTGKLLMPAVGTTGLENIVFGIASSADHWQKRKQYVEVWWKPGITRGFVWLDRPANFTSNPPIKVSEDTSRFKFTHPNAPRSALRLARIVLETFKLGLPNVKWFVMGDDDTVFVTENLVQVLNKYDHNQFYYIGSISECSEQNMAHSYNMAYGGGGFAISYPLAKVLAEILDGCIDRYSSLYGSDHRVQACLAEIGVPLTKEPGFHQIDLHGSLFGLLSSHPLVPLISVHHLDAMEPIFPRMTRTSGLKHLLKAARIDPGRVLQQSICYDQRRNWTVSVSWGYAIQIYNRIETPRILEYPMLTFWPWMYGKYPFMFNTRPVPKNRCDRPRVLFMKSVNFLNDNDTLGGIVSHYQTDDGIDSNQCNLSKNGNNVDRIAVFSEVQKHDLTLAPRRPCCDISYPGDNSNIDMRITIRSCRHRESVFQEYG